MYHYEYHKHLPLGLVGDLRRGDGLVEGVSPPEHRQHLCIEEICYEQDSFSKKLKLNQDVGDNKLPLTSPWASKYRLRLGHTRLPRMMTS